MARIERIRAGMIVLALLLYFVPLVLAYFATRAEPSRARRAGGVFLLLGLFIAAIWLLLLWNEMMGGLIFAAIFAVIIFPILCLGAGLTLGGWAKVLKLRGRAKLSRSVMFLAIFLPILGVAFLFYNVKQNADMHAARLAEYQSLTIPDRLAGEDVFLPISPQFELRYQCSREMDLPTRKICSENRFEEESRRLPISQRAMTAPRLLHINVQRVSASCEGLFSTAKDNKCTRQSEVAAWCARRTELRAHPLCLASPAFSVKFSRYISPDQLSEWSLNYDRQQWTEAGFSTIGLDTRGTPIAILCAAARDSARANRPHLKKRCRVRFSVTQSVIAETIIDGVADDQIVLEARGIVGYARTLWEALKTDPRATKKPR